MKLPKEVDNPVWVGLLGVLVLGFGSSAILKSSSHSWDETVGGLQMT